jgi:putative molybdopterin biosynthesis protein
METRTELPLIRKRRGVSAAQLAQLANVSRQTIYAIEAGEYVPNTTLALQLAKLLEVRVEDLFALEGDVAPPPKPLSVEILGGASGARKGQPVQICKVGKKWVGVAAASQPIMLPMADGVIVGASKLPVLKGPVKNAPKHTRAADVRVFPADESEGKRILVAGCDPGISLLTHHLAKTQGVDLVVAASSSQQALEWLKEDLVHVAGSHLRDVATGDYNLPAIHRMFPHGSVKAVTFAIWEQGLVFTGGNPKNIREVGDLARKDIRFINREKGAGSRDLLDRELRRAGIAPATVRGYDKIAYGHLPAALAVSSGDADCCIATRSAAQAFGLDFLPLATERYDLVIRRSFAKLPAVEALLDGLNRSAIRRKLELLAGYDTSHTGEVRLT